MLRPFIMEPGENEEITDAMQVRGGASRAQRKKKYPQGDALMAKAEVEKGMSLWRASRLFGVPESALLDEKPTKPKGTRRKRKTVQEALPSDPDHPCPESEDTKVVKRRRRRQGYTTEDVQKAFDAHLSGMSVYKAAHLYGVPDSTLRDRTLGNVPVVCQPGPDRLFSKEEENQLMIHIEQMAEKGHVYSKRHVKRIAYEFAVASDKVIRSDKDSLSQSWMTRFSKRWPRLNSLLKSPIPSVDKARKTARLAKVRETYSSELGRIIVEKGFLRMPERIYTIGVVELEEKDIDEENEDDEIDVQNRAVVVGANAIGNFVPPYYVFPSETWKDSLLRGSPAGSDGALSDSVDSSVLDSYVIHHLSKYACISDKSDSRPTLILYDGQQYHLSLTLAEWAKQRKVTMFVFPSQSGLYSQPLDHVGILKRIKNQFKEDCEVYLRVNCCKIVPDNRVARLTAVPYLKHMCGINIIQGFQKSGIFPFVNEFDEASNAGDGHLKLERHTDEGETEGRTLNDDDDDDSSVEENSDNDNEDVPVYPSVEADSTDEYDEVKDGGNGIHCIGDRIDSGNDIQSVGDRIDSGNDIQSVGDRIDGGDDMQCIDDRVNFVPVVIRTGTTEVHQDLSSAMASGNVVLEQVDAVDMPDIVGNEVEIG